MTPILPEDVDYDNRELERRSGHRRQADTEMFSSFTNGTGGLPQWASTMLAVSKAIAYVGVPSVIALFMVYQSESWLPGIQASGLKTEQGVQQVKELMSEQKQEQDKIYRLLQRICSNTAKTAEERGHCFDN